MNYIPYTLSECLTRAAWYERRAYQYPPQDLFGISVNADLAGRWYQAATIARKQGAAYVRFTIMQGIIVKEQPSKRVTK